MSDPLRALLHLALTWLGPSMLSLGWAPRPFPLLNPEGKQGISRGFGEDLGIGQGHERWGCSQGDEDSRSLLTWFLRLNASSQAWGRPREAKLHADSKQPQVLLLEITFLTSQSLTSPRSSFSSLPGPQLGPGALTWLGSNSWEGPSSHPIPIAKA